MPTSIEHIRAGRLRALAVTTATRSEALPDVPTVGEFVPGFEASAWYGVGAPKKTPAEIVDRLNKEINAGLADPKIKARLADLGGMVLAGSPADFGKLIADETEKWGKVVKFFRRYAGLIRLMLRIFGRMFRNIHSAKSLAGHSSSCRCAARDRRRGDRVSLATRCCICSRPLLAAHSRGRDCR